MIGYIVYYLLLLFFILLRFNARYYCNTIRPCVLCAVTIEYNNGNVKTCVRLFIFRRLFTTSITPRNVLFRSYGMEQYLSCQRRAQMCGVGWRLRGGGLRPSSSIGRIKIQTIKIIYNSVSQPGSPAEGI